VGIKNVNSADEAQISSAFPNAKIKENKGLTGLIDKLFGN
jgi:hypothetical protein